MPIYDVEIVIRHKIRYKANYLEDAVDCAEFDYLNEDELWLCDDVKSNWDVEVVNWGDELENGDQPVRDSAEYELDK